MKEGYSCRTYSSFLIFSFLFFIAETVATDRRVRSGALGQKRFFVENGCVGVLFSKMSMHHTPFWSGEGLRKHKHTIIAIPLGHLLL